MLSKQDLQRLFKKLPEDVVNYILQFEPAPAGGKLCQALQSARLCLQVANKLTAPFLTNSGSNECQFARSQVNLLSIVLRKACDFVKAACGGYDWCTSTQNKCWSAADQSYRTIEDPLSLKDDEAASGETKGDNNNDGNKRTFEVVCDDDWSTGISSDSNDMHDYWAKSGT
jgi:hypothetical protein